MIDKKKKSKKKQVVKKASLCCRVICADCNFHNSKYINKEWVDICDAFIPNERRDCVTGEKQESISRCDEHNRKGNCKKFKPLSNVRLRDLLRDYLVDNPRDWAYRDTIEHVLAEDLLRVLEKKNSMFFDELFYDETPFDHAVVVSKKAIEDSLHYRDYRLDTIERPGMYGGLYGSYDKEYDDECKKERSWIARVKHALE